ncbi:MAG TPA: bifunctional DNA primase/polymerase, partial [Ktedonobacterales bacterium]|nr:bifunctional DNA primase/polymerase [Ktedonobacterales bacterium]
MSTVLSSSLPNDRLKSWALVYANDGLPVLPLLPGMKTPAISKADGGNGFYDATTDTQRIEDWWMRYPGANIGIRTGATSGLLVIDVDPRHGGSLDALYARFSELRQARLAQSGNGGWHLYLRYPGFEVASGNRVLGPGIDVKCDKGYITAHPSHLASGGKYHWLKPYETPLLDCPPAVIESIRDYMAARNSRATTSRSLIGGTTSSSIGRYPPTATTLLADALRRTSDGVGDDIGYELARKLLAAQCGEVETLAVLISYGEDATANPRDPFTERDARRWLEQARNSEHVRHATTSEVDLEE